MSEHNLFWSEARKRYMLKFKTASGWKSKSVPKEIKTQKAAEFWAEQWLAAERAKSGTRAPSVLGSTVADKWEAWIDLRKGRDKRSSTHSDDTSHFKHHLLPFLGGDLIGAITVARVRELVRTLKKKRGRGGKGEILSGLKIRNIVQTLRLFLDDAKAEGWCALESNPARDPAVRTEMPAAERKSGNRVLYLTVEAVQAVLDHPEVSPIHKLEFLLGTLGLRAGEIAGLRFAKVMLEAEVPHLVVDVAVVTRSETGWAQEGDVKSSASERRVPLPPSYAAALRWWKRQGWALTYGASAPEPGDTLFPGRTRQLARPRVAEHLRLDLARAGQATHDGQHAFTFHHLRHSCATWLDEAGVDEPTIGALLGHEGKSVTRRSYTAATLTRLAEAAAKIPLRWNQGLGSGGSIGTIRTPLDLTKTLRDRMVAQVQRSGSHQAEPSERTAFDFVNRRSGVQIPKVAPGFWGPFGSIGTKDGTKTAPLTPRTDWALLAPVRRVA